MLSDSTASAQQPLVVRYTLVSQQQENNCQYREYIVIGHASKQVAILVH